MASPETLPFEDLVAPISGNQPAGVALREDPALSGLFFQVREAREAARRAEQQQLDAAMTPEDEELLFEPERPDWKAVHDQAVEIIGRHSKDLWVCAWLTEALTRLHGFAGLRDGFRLARELSEKYWDGIHPRPDEDGYVTTVAQFAGLNGEDSDGALITPIESIPIVPQTSRRPLTSLDYKDAIARSQAADPAKRRDSVTLEGFEKAVREAKTEYFELLLEDIDAALAEFDRLTTVFDEKCGDTSEGYSAAPPSSNIRSALTNVHDRVRSLTKDRLEPAAGKETKADGEDEDNEALPAGTVKGHAVRGDIRNREDAFRMLLKVADFFRDTEPHSPVSYALEQAVRWGRMSLPDLIKDLVSDQNVRGEMFRRTGIPDPDQPEGE